MLPIGDVIDFLVTAKDQIGTTLLLLGMELERKMEMRSNTFSNLLMLRMMMLLL